MKFADKTTVPVIRSRMEIETILSRYGASMFAYASQTDNAQVVFQMNGKRIRFLLPLPSRTDYMRKKRGYGNYPDDTINKLWEQACRQRWRALALTIKAKLESVECKISTFEEEFLAHIVLPDGRSAGDFLIPQIEEAYRTGGAPKMLMGGT